MEALIVTKGIFWDHREGGGNDFEKGPTVSQANTGKCFGSAKGLQDDGGPHSPPWSQCPAPSVSRGKQRARTLTRSRLTHLQLLVQLPEAHEPVWLQVPPSAAPLQHQGIRQLQFLC